MILRLHVPRWCIKLFCGRYLCVRLVKETLKALLVRRLGKVIELYALSR